MTAAGGRSGSAVTREERVVRKVGSDGVEREFLVLAPSGKPAALAIVFHPFGFDPESVLDGELPGERLMRPLEGFRAPARLHNLALVAPRGRGRVTEGSSLAWRPYLDSVWEVAGQCADEFNAPAIVTAGLSMGGLEALVLAGQHPGEVEATWAANPVVDVARWHGDILGVPLATMIELGVHETIELEIGGTPAEVPEAYRDRSATAYVEQLAATRLQIVWSPIDDVVHEQGAHHAGALALRVREAGGRVDERIVTQVPPAPIPETQRYAHQSADVWSGAAFLAHLDNRLGD
jgi:pimeloyl-ACP methyl ester carboxylesterase